MSVIIIPRKPPRQPRGTLKVPAEGPFAHGLKLAYLPYRNADIVTGAVGVARGGGWSQKHGPIGVAAESVSNGGIRIPFRLDGVTAPVSCFVLADRGPTEADTRGSALVEIGGAPSGNRILLEEDGVFGVAKLLYRNGAGAKSVSSSANGPSNAPTGYGFTLNSSHMQSFCGRAKSVYDAHTLGSAYSGLHASVLGEEVAWRGRIYAVYIWVGFELTAEMFSVLQADYLLPLRADPLRIYSFPSGPIGVSWSSLTASNITQTGATLTLGGITR